MPSPPKRLFAVDSGSPTSSVALAWDGEILTREFSVGDSSTLLLPHLDEMLEEVGGQLNQLEGLIAARGPGSFTGLRVGLATVLGLHQALGIPAGTVTTFEALARQARRRGVTEGRIYAVVDALRGEWFVQGFEGEGLVPLGEPELRSAKDMAGLGTNSVIGFGLDGLQIHGNQPAVMQATPLAIDLCEDGSQSEVVWGQGQLTRPLYLRPPAIAVSQRAADS